MSKMKGLAMGIALALGTSTSMVSAPAMAGGVPVIDVAAIAEAVRQYHQMVEQLKQLEAQLAQAKQQFESMTGTRGMEKLRRGDNQYIPTNWQETLEQMNGGKIGELAKSIKDTSRKVDGVLLERLLMKESGEALDQFGTAAANSQASAGQAYELSTQRFSRLQSLMDAIPEAQDPKAIADLQARIAVEQAMLQNESIKMQALAQTASAQQALQQNQMREMMLDRASSNNSMPAVR